MVNLDVHKKHEILFDKIMTHFLSNGSAEDLDKFITFFHKIDPLICEKVFTLSVTHEEIREVLQSFIKEFKLKNLINIIPKEDYFSIIEEIKYLLEDIIDEKIFHHNREDESGYECFSEEEGTV